MPCLRRHDSAPLLTELVGSRLFRRNVVLRSPAPPRSLTLWRVYPAARLACDRLERGQQPEPWRGEVVRAAGLRWMPFTRGEKVNRQQLTDKIARAA
jgi:hypothetical protein